jgi:hypothetical protein
MRRHRKLGPLFDPDHAGLDMAAIRADDALLDSLHAAQPPTDTSDPLREELAKLRDSARLDEPELVTVNTAQHAIRRGRRSRRRRRWFPWAFVISCAVAGILLLVLTGCGVGAIDSLAVPAPTTASPATDLGELPSVPPEEMRALMAPIGDGGPKVIIAPTAHVTGTYPARCVRGVADDPRLPVMSCTPGSVRSDITDATKAATICNPHWSTSTIRAPKAETDRLKTIAMAAYGVPASARSTTELDHDVPLWLGGSNDVSNLWAERSDLAGQGFRNSKDNVETRLHSAVCGRIPGMRPVPLRDAQVAIARDWVTAEAVLGIAA